MTLASVCDVAYEEAIKVLQACADPAGIKASATVEGYPHVWARDSMITLLGSSFVHDDIVQRANRASLDILRKHQTSRGAIPNNVDVATREPNFQAYADSGLWYVVGNVVHFKHTGDEEFLRDRFDSLQAVMQWYEWLDPDNTGLITMGEGTDWEDLLSVRDKGLYVNSLYHLALGLMNEVAEVMGAESYEGRMEELKDKINQYFWCSGEHNALDHIPFSVGTKKFLDEIRPAWRESRECKPDLPDAAYYLPFLAFRDFGSWFDSLGHFITIISGVADEERANIALDFIDDNGLAQPHPIKAIHPSIQRDSKDWRAYFTDNGLNDPDQYHNGGIWPFVGGFYVATLVKMGRMDQAVDALESLAQVNSLNNWEFNEWYHGITADPNGPKGMPQQAWSAGMYVYAYETVKAGKTLFFE